MAQHPTDTSAIAEIACQWNTKVLFRVGLDMELAIVEYHRPKELDPSEQTQLQALLEKLNSDSPRAIIEYSMGLDGLLY